MIVVLHEVGATGFAALRKTTEAYDCAIEGAYDCAIEGARDGLLDTRDFSVPDIEEFRLIARRDERDIPNF